MAVLSELLSGLNYEVLQAGDPQIKGLAYDSREVEDGFLFFALPGTHTDGIRFLAEAQRREPVPPWFKQRLNHCRLG